MSPKRKITLLVVAAVVGGLLLFIFTNTKTEQVIDEPIAPLVSELISSVLGTSVEGRPIRVYSYGTGSKHLAFVGGIHGGYEWNSTLLAYTFMDYLEAHPEYIPENITIDVIPSANPDALVKVVGTEGRFMAGDASTDADLLASARFNAHSVDLNRNFDCKWNPESTWRSKTVSGGVEAFSEPEAAAIKTYIEQYNPSSVVFWHSQSNAVYASQCEDGILPETVDIMNTYADAAGYPAVKTFDAYATTGAADDWLASIGIPAITVELKTHETIEWEKNIAGIRALMEYYK